MGSENTGFEAVVIAALGVILGVAYLLGGMLALLSDGGNDVLLLADSISATVTIGILLMLTAGFLGTKHSHSRYLGVIAFGAVAVFGRPAVATPEAFPVVQAGLAFLVALYMAFRNPVPATERSNVDESTSATKVGSTIR